MAPRGALGSVQSGRLLVDHGAMVPAQNDRPGRVAESALARQAEERRINRIAEHHRQRRRAVDEIGSPLFGVRSPSVLGGTVSGWGGDGTRANTVRITHHPVTGRGWVEVETRTSGYRALEPTIVSEVIGSDVSSRPKFPVTSTVVKEKVRVTVDGRQRWLPVYRCGTTSVLVGRVKERWVHLRAVGVGIEALSIVSLSLSEIDEALGGEHAADDRT